MTRRAMRAAVAMADRTEAAVTVAIRIAGGGWPAAGELAPAARRAVAAASAATVSPARTMSPMSGGSAGNESTLVGASLPR